MDEETITIYILELQCNKYYVGSSSHPNPLTRIKKHF